MDGDCRDKGQGSRAKGQGNRLQARKKAMGSKEKLSDCLRACYEFLFFCLTTAQMCSIL
jgi:hypothetical protein